MSAKSKLRRALSGIEDVKRVLERALSLSHGDNEHVRRALREIDEIESDIRRAIRDTPSE